jgi:serine/threonine protein kinase
MAVAPGVRLGQYEIISLLGSGGGGEVYRARDSRLGREVAIKILRRLPTGDPDGLRRFEREAHALAALNHPNIVTIHSVEEADGIRFFTMEVVEGKPLCHLIPKDGMLLDRLKNIAIQLATALAAAHGKNIIHRDLKPANIIISAEGRVKILDFGLAKLNESDRAGVDTADLATRQITEEVRIVGTVAYMSPEQAEGKPVDSRSDLFSVGTILFELATGERPFKGNTTLAVMSSIINDAPPSVTMLNPSVSRDLAKIIVRCLNKDPEHRYQTAKDLRNALQELSPDADAHGAQHSPGTGVGASSAMTIRQTPWATRWGREASKAASIFVVVTVLRAYLEQVPVGDYFRNFEYAVLQLALRSEFAATSPLHRKDRHILPVVVDISRVPFDRSRPTNRQMIDELIDALEDMNAAAIGVDIDFSPDDRGKFITTRDPQLFLKWRELRNVRIGVFRREGDAPHHWLGHREFRDLAAGIMLPESDAGYAYQFSSPDLSAWPDNPNDYLLQMPAALYDITHPGRRSRIVEDPHVKRVVMQQRIRVGRYPIDYSFRDYIPAIPYRNKVDLAQWADQIDGRVVLIGDLHEAEDSRSIPGLTEPVAGVIIHAAALATLNRGLLRYIDEKTSRWFEVALFVCVLGTLGALQYAQSTVPRLRRVDADDMEIVSAACATLVVLAMSIGFLGLTHFFWPDFLWIAVAFLLWPYVGRVASVALRGARGIASSTAGT